VYGDVCAGIAVNCKLLLDEANNISM
jgi:hypothetical protein